MLLGFGRTANYKIFPKTSLNTLPLSKDFITKLIKYVPYRLIRGLFNFSPKFIKKPIRDFLWIEDAVNALIKIALGKATGIFNVASGEAVSINELISKILNKSGIDKKVKILVSKPNKIVSIIKPDILDTFTSFGWKPKMKLENGINELLNKKKG